MNSTVFITNCVWCLTIGYIRRQLHFQKPLDIRIHVILLNVTWSSRSQSSCDFENCKPCEEIFFSSHLLYVSASHSHPKQRTKHDSFFFQSAASPEKWDFWSRELPQILQYAQYSDLSFPYSETNWPKEYKCHNWMLESTVPGSTVFSTFSHTQIDLLLAKR